MATKAKDSNKLGFANNVLKFRKSLGESQAEFWGRYGVTQGGGSRYEQGRRIPTATKILIALHKSGKITNEDLEAERLVISTAAQ